MNTGFLSTPTVKHWECPRGHHWSGSPFVVTVCLDATQIRTTKPLCPYCIGERLDEAFPASEFVAS